MENEACVTCKEESKPRKGSFLPPRAFSPSQFTSRSWHLLQPLGFCCRLGMVLTQMVKIGFCKDMENACE